MVRGCVSMVAEMSMEKLKSPIAEAGLSHQNIVEKSALQALAREAIGQLTLQ